MTGFHRASRAEDGGDVQSHRCHEHTRSDFVAVADANHCIGAVSVHHIFNAVGNQVARGQRIQHAVVTHGYAVVDGYGVEFGGKAAETFNFSFHFLSNLVQVSVSGDKLSERVNHGNNRFAHLLGLHAVSNP